MFSRNVKLLQRIIDENKDINIDAVDKNGKTPLYYALTNENNFQLIYMLRSVHPEEYHLRNDDQVKCLLRNGADPEKTIKLLLEGKLNRPIGSHSNERLLISNLIAVTELVTGKKISYTEMNYYSDFLSKTFQHHNTDKLEIEVDELKQRIKSKDLELLELRSKLSETK